MNYDKSVGRGVAEFAPQWQIADPDPGPAPSPAVSCDELISGIMFFACRKLQDL